jgi:zinc protease
VYGRDHILTNKYLGTITSVGKITLNDLKRYYEQYFSPSVCKISIVGDITQEKAVVLFNGLNDWKSKEVKIPDVASPAPVKPGIYFVDIPGAKQSQVYAGHLGLSKPDPDFFKATVINHRLGGDFSSILNTILREKKSFTYGVRSDFTGDSYAGKFMVSTAVQTNATFESIQIIRDEIKKYLEGISKDDLDGVKSTLLNSNAGGFETLWSLSGMLQEVVWFNLPFDYIRKQQEIIRDMTPEEHALLTKKLIHPDNMIYLVVGDKATQFEKLKELGLGDPVLLDKDAQPVSK